MACLAADNQWMEGSVWIQESVIGSHYHLSYKNGNNGGVIVTIEGEAFVTGEIIPVFEDRDPFRCGI